ncbi:MAG TPA: hypothetical protein PKE16_19500, partial [Hyphomicrobium sp.]|nr:hypothetical protein [Hyphomicrobium sp.]
GKAIVATSVSVEGIDDDVLAHFAVCDDAIAFAQAVSKLLLDDGLRTEKAREAFDAYRRCYSQESCYQELLQFLRRGAAQMSGPAHVSRQLPQASSQAPGNSIVSAQ